jgi:hypothetical protein
MKFIIKPTSTLHDLNGVPEIVWTATNEQGDQKLCCILWLSDEAQDLSVNKEKEEKQDDRINSDPDALLGEQAAARYLGISARFLQKHRCDGDGPPFVRISGRCIRYRRRDLTDWSASLIRTSVASK